MVQYFLESKGFRVCVAVDGKKAVALSAKIKPNIILMDLNLPVLDGWEATRIIRSAPATSKIPILVVSAYCRNLEFKQAAIEAGAIDCLYKPIEIEKLPALIKDYALY